MGGRIGRCPRSTMYRDIQKHWRHDNQHRQQNSPLSIKQFSYIFFLWIIVLLCGYVFRLFEKKKEKEVLAVALMSRRTISGWPWWPPAWNVSTRKLKGTFIAAHCCCGGSPLYRAIVWSIFLHKRQITQHPTLSNNLTKTPFNQIPFKMYTIVHNKLFRCLCRLLYNRKKQVNKLSPVWV